jgi:hypothetical protein
MRSLRTTLLTAIAAIGLIGATWTGVAAQDASPSGAPIAFPAAAATITVDGDTSDWSAVEGATITLEQIRLEGLDPTQAEEIEFGPLPPVEATLKVANDAENLYVLVEVQDAFDYIAEDHNRSASLAVQFRIDEAAAAHMGADEADLLESLGMVDMWHWELDCAPGAVSGGQGIAGGDDPACNLDDEYATAPERREDDGGGDVENPAAENGLMGVWGHTGAAAGPGADGAWIFEMSRPLQTGDPQDAQLASGQIAYVALAYFDPSEGPEGWSDAGHLNSAYNGWVEVALQ